MKKIAKILCEICGKYFYIGDNVNKKSKLRNCKKCPSCRGGMPPWTKSDIDMLIFLRRNTNKNLDEIAKELGRTREACSNKLIRLRVKKDFLGDYRRARCILCGEESGRFTKAWSLLIKGKYVCYECRKYFGKTKIINDIKYISINKNFYYPLHYLVWLIKGKSLPYREIVTHINNPMDNSIDNLKLGSIKEVNGGGENT